MNAERKDVLSSEGFHCCDSSAPLLTLSQVLPALLALTNIIDQRLSQEIQTEESAAMLSAEMVTGL